MKLMSKRDAALLEHLTAGLVNPCGDGQSCRRFESGGYLPLVVERIGDRLFSLAHYVSQNGDPCRDPEQTFYRAAADVWAACSWRNDLVGVDRESVVFSYENGTETVTGVRLRGQREAASFAAMWLRNLRAQHPDLSAAKRRAA